MLMNVLHTKGGVVVGGIELSPPTVGLFGNMGTKSRFLEHYKFRLSLRVTEK